MCKSKVTDGTVLLHLISRKASSMDGLGGLWSRMNCGKMEVEFKEEI